MTPLKVKLARQCLLRGGLLAYPTEAVWGLGCDPWNQQAVNKLLTLKQRPLEKGLILIGASIQQLGPLYDLLNEELQARLRASWPGHTTWLIPDPQLLIPSWIKGQHNKVAIRVSAHLTVRSLSEEFGGLMVSTSANLANQAEIRSRLKLIRSLGDKLDFVLPGQLGTDAEPSTIKDLETNEVIRQG